MIFNENLTLHRAVYQTVRFCRKYNNNRYTIIITVCHIIVCVRVMFYINKNKTSGEIIIIAIIARTIYNCCDIT